MEKNKKSQPNSATEKVEKIIETNNMTPAEKLKAEIEQERQKLANNAVNNRMLTEQERVDALLNREKEREERAVLKNIEREQKQKSRQDRKNARIKMMNDFKDRIIQKREERRKRKDELKSQTSKDRRQQKARQRAGEKEQRAMLKREKLEQKMELKKQKAELKHKQKQQKRERGVGGWLAAVISLASACLILTMLFVVSLLMPDVSGDMYESVMEKNFFDLVDYVENIDVNMSKLMVSNDKREQQKLLSDIVVEANLATSAINEIPMHDESKYYTVKYINQLGDYAKYLDYRLIDGESITKNDEKSLNALYQINATLLKELKSVEGEMGEDYRFISLLKDGESNLVLDGFTRLEEGAVAYPELIYDGPFSDGLNQKKAKGLSGEEISATTAIEKFNSIFSSMAFDNVEVTGETDGRIKVYNVEGKVKEQMVFAQISKVGGHLISFNNFVDLSKAVYDREECLAVAKDFLKEIGFTDMQAVWQAEDNSCVTINFVKKQDDTIIYPDMVKVIVCRERGEVSSFDATEYYLNHQKRNIESPKISEKQAVKNISANIEIEFTRLCLIPKGNDNEALCYEVCGSNQGSTYYVYVDAKTGNEIKIFKVVETAEGNLLI